MGISDIFKKIFKVKNDKLDKLSEFRYDQAIDDYTRTLQVYPRDSEAYYSRGVFYALDGQDERAIADYTRALEINPSHAIAYSARARAHFRKKEFDKAWEDVRQAQSLGHKVNPEFLQALRKASGRQN
jgi:tetratricopeptide (TPR) repeat protein